MHRIIAGGTGLIGQRLTEHWLKQNYTISIIGRSKSHIEKVFGNSVTALSWENLTEEDLKSAELIVNLTGENVGAARWTEARKKEILISRVGTTKKLASLLSKFDNTIPLFNASAIGIYGVQNHLSDQLPPKLDEETPINWDQSTDFIALVGCRWEKAAEAAVLHGNRVVFLRFGVVLASENGALPQLMKAYQFYMGGPIGSGQQPFSWVAINDVIGAIDFLVAQPTISGPVNIVAPDCVKQDTFSKTLANVMNKPNLMRKPAFLLKLLLGHEMAHYLLLEGQNVYPTRLLDRGFNFSYPDLETALNHLLHQSVKKKK